TPSHCLSPLWRRTLRCTVLALLVPLVLGALTPRAARAETVQGNIAVYSGSTLLGYVRKTYDGYNVFTYTPDLSQALVVQFDTAATEPFAITVVNPFNSANPYFGAVGGYYGYTFKPGQSGYAFLSGTSLTPAGSPPSSSATNDLQA